MTFTSNCCLLSGKLGANAILAVSLAVCKAGAAHKVRHFHNDWSIHQCCQYRNLLAHTLPFLQCFCTYHYNANLSNIFLDLDIADLTSCTYTWQAIATGAHDIWDNHYKNHFGCSNDTLSCGDDHNKWYYWLLSGVSVLIKISKLFFQSTTLCIFLNSCSEIEMRSYLPCIYYIHSIL